MSREILIESLSDYIKEKISNDLEIKIEGSTFVYNSQPKSIYPMDITETHAYIPFAYGRTCVGGPFKCPDKNTFPITEVVFEGELRPMQKEIKTEAISHLNKYGSTIISAFPGAGKCLSFNTPVLMFDGTIKMVQDILSGEKIMGDDSTSRNVLSICNGEEKMYDIIPVKGNQFTVNESHILSLKIYPYRSLYLDKSGTYICKMFDKNSMKYNKKKMSNVKDWCEYLFNTNTQDSILDISIKNYLKLSKKIKNKLKCYKVPILFQEKEVELDPYILGLWLGNKNIDFSIPNYQNILDYLSKNFKDDLTLRLTQYNLIDNKHIPHIYKCNSKNVRLQILAGILDNNGYVYKNSYKIILNNIVLIEDITYMVKSLGFESYKKLVNDDNKIYMITIFGNGLEKIPVLHTKKIFFKTEKDLLLTDFNVIPSNEKKYYGFEIDGNHRFILGDFTVTHNTSISIYISTKIKVPTLVITHRIVLIKQWKEAIKKFCPNSSIQVLDAKTVMKNCDFYIMNPSNVPKNPKSFYKNIGFLIVDECFPGNTLILTESGYLTIKNIHTSIQKGNKHIIKTYNETNKQFELKEVINSRKIKLNKNMVTIKYCNGSRQTRSTDNHKFLTTSGYVEASKLTLNDLIISYYTEEKYNDITRALNNDQIQIILGSYLGVGHIECLKGQRYRMNVYHKNIDYNYSLWKASMLNCLQETIYTPGFLKKVGYKFTTNKFDFSDIFPNKKDCCPQWVIDKIDLRGIFILYMDSGLLDKDGNIVIYINSFCNDSIIRLIKKFNEFNIFCTLLINNKTKLIKLDYKNTIVLLTLISPYLYYRNTLEKDVYKWNHKFENYGYLKIKEIIIDTNPSEKYVYDIQVRDNHNFIVTNNKGLNGAVVHNCHLIMAESLSKSMQQILPRYVLGLSATPYREDDLNILLDLYFGTNKIDRKLYREHKVYKLNTSFTPPVELAKNGKINWGVILDSQSLNKNRNEMIVNIVKFFPDRVFLILCKRVDQGEYIVTRLREENEDVTSLIGKQQEYEQKSRILVGTTGKCSVGFDHPRLNTLLLASDMQAYFVQVLGRIMRTQEGIPMVIDIVDKNPILERHYKVRHSVYLEHGGIIKDFSKEFKDFKQIL
jgi:superfamily II DNA or RNA helicase